MKPNSACGSHVRKTLASLIFLLLPTALLAEPLPLKRAVELALTHGTSAAIAQADQQHAVDAYRELRNNYIPQLIAGAGLGWSDGFPLSLEGAAPSLLNVTAQSVLVNPALKDFLHAARADYNVSSLHTKDERSQIIQDTILSYAELVKWEQRLARLQETQFAAEKMQTAVEQRVKEGIDSGIESTKARLSVARIRLRIAEAGGSADVLREHLAKLTGVPAASIQTVPDSVPGLPIVKEDDNVTSKALDANPAVRGAVEHARAQYLRAKAERKSLWPSMDFAAQYSLFSTSINDYERFYQPHTFQPNNATVGVSIHFPFLNLSQHARAQEAKSEAFKAQKQAEAARNQASEETLRLQRNVEQMQAARDVAALEYEIAQNGLEVVQTRMDSGSATLHDLDDARSQASERFIALQDVTFEMQRSQVGLLRSTGELEKWVMGAP
jgi:outer membrane protein